MHGRYRPQTSRITEESGASHGYNNQYTMEDEESGGGGGVRKKSIQDEILEDIIKKQEQPSTSRHPLTKYGQHPRYMQENRSASPHGALLGMEEGGRGYNREGMALPPPPGTSSRAGGGGGYGPAEDLAYVSDLSSLQVLTEDTILEVIRRRFHRGKYYTNVGDVLIAVNPCQTVPIYNKQFHAKYSEEPREFVEPHIFRLAQRCYSRMRAQNMDQAILISGESGSGKTVSTQHLVKQLAYISKTSNTHQQQLHNKIIEVNPLIEAFGNARTPHNANSSRFAKYMQLMFDKKHGTLVGAEISDYMLEKSRVVSQRKGEKNFRMLYYFIGGMEPGKYGLMEPENYRIIQDHRGQVFPDQTVHNACAKEYQAKLQVMSDVGFTPEDIIFVEKVLAAVFHISNIDFETETQMEKIFLVTPNGEIERVAELLQLNAEELSDLFVWNIIHDPRRPTKPISTFKTVAQAQDTRDAIAKTLYHRLFGWLIKRINHYLNPNEIPSHSCRTVGILDMAGFEELSHNGLEQLFINTSNERMQHFFNHHLLSQEQRDYKYGGIDWQRMHYQNNDKLLELFLGNRREAGLLKILDDVTHVPQYTEQDLLSQWSSMLCENPHFHQLRDTHRLGFGVKHSFSLLGSEVRYDVEDMIELNRDKLDVQAELCFSASGDSNVRDMFHEEALTDRTGSYSRSSGLGSGSSSSRRHKPNKTLAQSFRHSLYDLMEKLESAQCLFVRCIKPNAKSSSKEIDESLVENQLRYSGLLEIAKLRKIGYPVRMPYDVFNDRYSFLRPFAPRSDPRSCTESILKEVHISDAEFGDDKIFLKDVHKDILDREMRKIRSAVRKIERRRKQILILRRWLHLVKVAAEQYRKMKRHKRHRERTKPPGYSEKDPNKAKYYGGSDITPDDQDDESWDMPRNIPWERKDKSESYVPLLRAIKVIFYVVLLAGILFLLVASKLSLLVMTSEMWMGGVTTTESGAVEREKSEMRKAATSLMICLCVPHAMTFLVGLLKAFFGGQPWPGRIEFIWMMIVESVHTLGLCFLVYLVLPQLDMVRAILLMSCTGILPGLMKVFIASCPKMGKILKNPEARKSPQTQTLNTSKKEEFIENPWNGTLKVSWYFFNSLAVLVQMGTVVYVMLGESFQLRQVLVDQTDDPTARTVRVVLPNDPTTFANMWQIPLALICVSIKWWENFVDRDISVAGMTLPLQQWKENMHEHRQKISFIASMLSMAIIITFPIIAIEDYEFDMYGKRQRDWKHLAPLIFQGLSGLVCYVLSLAACMLCMQLFSFTIPLLLATPASLVVVALHCTIGIPMLEDLLWVCPEGLGQFLTNVDNPKWSTEGSTSYYNLAALVACWIAMMVICGHVWYPRQNVLDTSEKLFITPLYCGPLLEQSLLLNRRRRDKDVRYSSMGFHWYKGKYYLDSSHWTNTHSDGSTQEEEKVVPLIHACATLWHETRNEMEQLLKSVFRLDRNQNTRRNQKEIIGFDDPNYYELQVHMFFDDAMCKNDDGDAVPNQFVHQFMDCVNSAGSSVLECQLVMSPPIKIPTPYGGRLVWTLPGGTKMYVHMKDKNKIRHRKRWSQVMYMYYLLSYQLLTLSDESVWQEGDGDVRANQEDRQNFFFSRSNFFKSLPEEVVLKAENTFLLALDGDVDFKPDALRLLMDLMKRNKNVGAACGRIHPIGSTPIVWYQVFEYAIAHWLQKAAEHIFGCVLCSPGCFSLFRGSAIMDDNVMKTYTKKAEEPMHYVQYDQGEDRWLCTLLLQAGYKVEYSAAADALTYCPESFDEFYNQRRRWAPSTMANIIDLIGSFRHTVENNNNISFLYMVYQILLFASSLIAPGTILLSIAGSFRVILKTSFAASYMLAIEPAVFYVFICMTCKQKVQLTVAAIMSAGYAIIMTVSIIGTLVTYLMGSGLNPNLIFLCGLIAFFLTAGIIHPQEFTCLLPAPMFFLCVPSGYLLLTIYSLCNLNVVSWGTREIAQPKTAAEKKKEEEERAQKEKEKASNKKGLLDWLGIGKILGDVKDFYVSMTSSRQNSERVETQAVLSSLVGAIENLNDKIDNNNQGTPGSARPQRAETSILRRATTTRTPPNTDGRVSFGVDQVQAPATPIPPPTPPPAKKRDDLVNPAWIEDDKLGRGEKQSLQRKEILFWVNFIKKYLAPLDENPEDKKRLSVELAALRTFVVLGFCIINTLWIVITFLLQYLGEDDAIRERLYVPLGKSEDSDRFEPFGLLFLTFFTVVIVLQFVAAVIHRLGTLLHLLAVTDVVGEGRNLDLAFKVLEDLNNFNQLKDEDIDSTLYPSMSDAGMAVGDTPPELPPNRHKPMKILKQMTQMGENPPPDYTQYDRHRRPVYHDHHHRGHKARRPQVIHADKDILTQQFLKRIGHQKSMLPSNRENVGHLPRRYKNKEQMRFSQHEREQFLDSVREYGRHRPSGNRPRLHDDRRHRHHRNDRRRYDDERSGGRRHGGGWGDERSGGGAYRRRRDHHDY